MIRWPHQDLALAGINSAVSDGARDICVAAPTGGGKSKILFDHLSERPSAIVYTNRRMLLDQLAGGLTNNGVKFGYRAAGHDPRLLDNYQLAMIPSEASRVIRGREVHQTEYVYVDELHQNKGNQMQGLLSLHRKAKADSVMVGFTATPLGIGHMADTLIVAGTNSELRACGALVPAYHYGPDEPDTKWIGKVKVDEGECGIPNAKRMEFAHRVFGSVIEHYWEINPQQKPTILFAPGVAESIWFAKELSERGIPSAHIDGANCWLDGNEVKNDTGVREEIAARAKRGDIKVVCNRFVLREGIDWPWLEHCIMATVFGSLTSYIQAGGRMLRANDGKPSCSIQDHGGNSWRHGSLNENREWRLEYDDRIVAGLREDRMRSKKEREPITCPRCHALRLSGPVCYQCGHRHDSKVRMVLQANGQLKPVSGDIFRPRRELPDDDKIKRDWAARVKAVQRSQKPTVKSMTFAQLSATFARDHRWAWPRRDWPMMPARPIDFHRRVQDCTEFNTQARQLANAERW